MPVQTIAGTRIWPISLEQIEATIADYLGPGRVKSKSPAPVFSRHVSMYLAKHVGGWCSSMSVAFTLAHLSKPRPGRRSLSRPCWPDRFDHAPRRGYQRYSIRPSATLISVTCGQDLTAGVGRCTYMPGQTRQPELESGRSAQPYRSVAAGRQPRTACSAIQFTNPQSNQPHNVEGRLRVKCTMCVVCCPPDPLSGACGDIAVMA
jgi:hypothetical protein